MMTTRSFLARFLVLLPLTGCASGASVGAPSKPLAQFPTRAEMAATPDRPLPASVFIEHATRVESWDIDPASVPAPGATVEARPAELARGMFGPQARASAEMTCVAREFGRLHLSKGGAPNESLRRYLIGRCGSSLPMVSFSTITANVPAQVPDEQLWKQVLARPQPHVEAHGSAPAQAGAALVRQGDRAVFVVVGGQSPAELAPVAPLAAGVNEVVLRGTVGEPSELVRGLINQGPHGFAECQPIEALAPPRFALRCPVAPGDESAWVEVVTKAPKKLLARAVLSTLVRRDGAKAGYSTTLTEIRPSGNFNQDLLAHLNAARARGGLSPLALSAEQSSVNQHNAGAILTAMYGNSGDSERLTLGLMAGWEVQGLIRRGDLLALITSSTSESAAWLAGALERPTSRSVLMHPDRRVIAIGAASPSPQLGVGAVISTYALFEGNQHQADAAQVFARLNEARARRGLPPSALVTDLPPVLAAADRIFKGTQNVEPAVNDALEEASQQLGRPLQGVYFEAVDLDSLEFPEPLLTGPLPGVSITVTHHRAPGAAWGQYVVMLVVVPPAPSQSAQALTTPRG